MTVGHFVAWLVPVSFTRTYVMFTVWVEAESAADAQELVRVNVEAIPLSRGEATVGEASRA